MNQTVMLGAGAVVFVLIIVAVYFIVTAPHSGTTTTTTTVIPGSSASTNASTTEEGSGRILSYSINPGSNGMCSVDAQCRDGSKCANGSCTVHECNKCVPYGTTELGNPDCLDFWDKPANEQRMLDKMGDRFAAPISSHSCENFNPYFELETPAGSCSVSFSNRCQQTS